jgi:hypothetical protein
VPLFTIDTSALLSSPTGTMEEFQFAQEIPVDTWDDLVCEGELRMHIKLMKETYGIECILSSVEATIGIPSEGIEDKSLEIENISREFHLKKKPDDTDDIEYVADHDGTIDLTRVIEQELLIAGL